MQEKSTSPVLYSNNIQLTTGQYELVLTFGFKDQTQDIVLSWPHAKKFLEVLKTSVEAFEELYGVLITEPNPEVVKKLEKEGKLHMIKVPQ